MDGNDSINSHKPKQLNTLEQVKTHFGLLKTERVPMIISLEGLPDANEYKKVVDTFYEDLRNRHPYQFQDIIGEGGMGIVEKVKDKKCLRSIAKKTLNPTKYDQESIVRFTEEAQITAQLEHPNIVPVYEMGLDDKNRLFYTMKMVKGRNLKEILRLIKNNDEETIKKFPLSNLLEIFTAVCDAMSYACSKKIVHRDLKPDNIMVGDYGEVYIVDWGLAKIINSESSSSTEQVPEWIVNEVYNKTDKPTDKLLKELRSIDSLRTKDKNLNISFHDILIGTPQYMAPERISGEADECSEVYALGAILYNILTLELTVQGDNLEEIVTKILNEDIKSPLKFNKLPHLPSGKIPSSLAAVTMKALSAEPIDRYHRVSQLRNEISAWEDGYITEAEKAGPWLILWSNIKRHKIESAIALTFISLLIIIYTFYAINLKEDRLQAENSEKIALTQKLLAEKVTQNISDQSREVQGKISELQRLAPELYERSNFFLKNLQPKKALNTIKDAIRIKPTEAYYVLCGNIQQTLSLFEESIESYNQAMAFKPNSKTIKAAISFSNRFKKQSMNSYLDLLNFRDFLSRQDRLIEAAYVSRKLLKRTRNMKLNILKKLETTHLSFIKGKQLTFDQNGGLTLNLQSMNISDISPLAGMPFKSLNLNNNPISDISALKNMPLETLDLGNTKIKSLKALKGSSLKVLKVYNTPLKSLEGLNQSFLTTLEVFGTPITSLAGVKTKDLKTLNISKTEIKRIQKSSFKSLRYLNINFTEINDLSPFTNAPLTSLFLRNSRVSDLAPIQKTFLNILDISGCQIDDYKVLSKLPLEKIDADHSNLSDLTFLIGKKLTSLSAEATKISSLTPLDGMPIKKLNLSQTAISDLSILENLPLEELRLNDCKAQQFPTLMNMNNMLSIWLRGSEIEDFSTLNNRHFKILDLAYSKIKSLDSFKECTIQHLDISSTAISDLTPLKGKSIEFLNLDDTTVTNLSPLADCLIDKLYISRVAATDFSPLAKIKLVGLYAKEVKITKVNFINKTSIQYLDLSSSNINDLSFLRGSNIHYLNLAHTQVTDLEPLSSCSNLKYLDLYGTEIERLQPLVKIQLHSLVIGECNKLKNLNPVRRMRSLRKLIFPAKIKNLEFLKNLDKLQILGTSSAHHEQGVESFWQKHKQKVNDEQ